MIKMRIENIKTVDLIPYENNPRLNDGAVDGVVASIKEFGFKVPIVVDKNNVIVCGHTRHKAALRIGLESVPCIRADDLSDEQIKAFRLADNKVSEAADWDIGKLNIEISEIEDIDMSDFGFDLDVKPDESWFETRDRNDTSKQEGNDEYNEFLDKFEVAKTTDDCYTPDGIYEVVKDWVVSHYNISNEIIRPFYPGGDYQKEKYKGKTVIDNPPFSILAEIIDFYQEKGIKFFLFAPSVTLMHHTRREGIAAICTGVSITYENGAIVPTSFLTNMEDDSIAAKTESVLYKLVYEEDKRIQSETKKEIPKYEYPDNIVTAAMLSKFSKYGADLEIRRKDCMTISALDQQKEVGKAIFGNGLLLSEKAAAEKAAAEKAAAEKAAAEKWTLSEREIQLVKSLG